MSEIADFLRARYLEARKREEGVRRMKFPGPFDGHEVEVDHDGRVLIDNHEYPAEQYWELASEPGADPFVIADLDAKLAIVKHMEETLKFAEGDTEVDHYGALDAAEQTLRTLAQPFAGHPDHKGEEWAP